MGDETACVAVDNGACGSRWPGGKRLVCGLYDLRYACTAAAFVADMENICCRRVEPFLWCQGSMEPGQGCVMPFHLC